VSTPFDDTSTAAEVEYAGPQAEPFFLLAFDGNHASQVPLPRNGEILIGRDASCAVQLGDRSVSRYHARIIMKDGAAVLRDLDSRNGTTINGLRLRGERLLTASDVLTVGDVQIVYVAPRTPVPLAPVPERGGDHFTEVASERYLVAEPSMRAIFRLLERIANSDLAVLIGGETGTGKEVAALTVHARSGRATGPFVPLNCGAIPSELVESTLFGHERGAFTGANEARPGVFESASGGTLFLDELGELPLAAQAKLLRVLERRRILRVGDSRERDVNVRVIAATSRDLEADVAAGRFRADLFFRVSVATVWLPPLRARPGELPLLTRHFLDAATARQGRPRLALSAEVNERLQQYPWPGNVRELKNLADFLAVKVDGDVVSLADLPERFLRTVRAPVPEPRVETAASLAHMVRDAERERIEEALVKTGGNQTRAAALLGIPRRTFVAKLKRHGLGGPRRWKR
jgi:DNA-binding NtrC family response regulator